MRKFEKEFNYTDRNYLIERCAALPRQIEKKFKNAVAYHTESTCFGMSNYINIEKQDNDGEYIDSIDIRISDHAPTGSGSPCDAYIYIQDKTWMEVKREILDVVENFMRAE